ncbi:MAG: lipopolysaccharide export system protein LptA [Oleispira sp.]|jgi:lipopolysaccharide export system protein LptA
MSLKTLSVVLLLLTCFDAYSLESDADAEITIQSDRAEFDRKLGTAVYRGSVILQQGTLLINADQITLFSDTEQRLNKAVAQGTPARFQQQMEGDKGVTKGQGNVITYLTQDKTVSFFKDASLKQKGSSFSGNLITYDIVNENVKAKGQTESQAVPNIDQPSGRIKMIIQPAQPAKKPAEKNTNEDA